MKKFFIIGILFALVFLLNGCGRETATGEYADISADPSKTALFVYSIDGGVGVEWLYNIERKFEEMYKDVSFEEGKKGVDIVVHKGKDLMTGNVTSQKYSVIFSETVPVFDLASQKALLPITEMVRSSLSDMTNGNETVSIESKLTDSQKAALTSINGEYYFLPHFETYSGLSYDKKVFNDYSLFIKEGSGWTSEDSEKTVGPNGIRGDYDDGLPSSVEELEKLLDRCANLGIAPVIWSGAYESYVTRLLVGLSASIAGFDEYMLNFSYGSDSVTNGGTARIITGFNGDDPVVEEVEITKNNGYLMLQEESKYYALKVLSKIFSNTKYYSEKINETLTHELCQEEFILSDLENNPISMIIEGSYWYNEAKDAIKRSISSYGESAQNRQIEWMPLPVQVFGSVTEGNGRIPTLVDGNGSYCFINANVEEDEVKKDLSLKFLKFCYTNDSLVNFVETTGIFKGVSMNYDTLDVSKLDNYKKSIVNIRKNASVVYPISDNPITVKSLPQVLLNWNSVVSSIPYQHPGTAYRSNITAKDYFVGMWSNEQTWNNTFGELINK